MRLQIDEVIKPGVESVDEVIEPPLDSVDKTIELALDSIDTLLEAVHSHLELLNAYLEPPEREFDVLALLDEVFAHLVEAPVDRHRQRIELPLDDLNTLGQRIQIARHLRHHQPTIVDHGRTTCAAIAIVIWPAIRDADGRNDAEISTPKALTCRRKRDQDLHGDGLHFAPVGSFLK